MKAADSSCPCSVPYSHPYSDNLTLYSTARHRYTLSQSCGSSHHDERSSVLKMSRACDLRVLFLFFYKSNRFYLSSVIIFPFARLFPTNDGHYLSVGSCFHRVHQYIFGGLSIPLSLAPAVCFHISPNATPPLCVLPPFKFRYEIIIRCTSYLYITVPTAFII